MAQEWSRRDLLKTMGALSVGAAMSNQLWAGPMQEATYTWDYTQLPKAGRKITAITLGAGSRGNVYGNYALKHPDELDIIGVAEPIPLRNERYSKNHNIIDANRFVTWEHVFTRPKFADAVIITTPDNLHYGPAMKALEMGYDLLLEKPIAQSWKECNDILQQAKKYKRIVAVCHVLRYSPYYRKVKEVMDSGVLGSIVSVQHLEPIQHVHMSHSYVRGNWRREEDTNPIILAKSCHDLDILRWWLGKNCRYISSFGSLKWFKSENAPAGSTARCTDGCAVEAQCPYSALRIYHKNRTWLHHFDLPAEKELQGDAIMKYLKEGQYGRCVYRCDNDVPDHQIVAMEFEDQITVNFSMEAFTNYAGRRTRIMGSMGDLVGDENELYIADFRTGEITKWNVRDHADLNSGHGGGDWGLARDWVRAVEQQNPALLTSSLDASMESHLMGFLAEKSRKERTVERVDMG
ncbi:MAG: Gfo/Idh/MocA family oxidoreductase [Saprospiraceae bacterium]|nr:Gfo/Idh/MocA family oxidoreductase [Saprospiraceae bacterium]